MAALLALETEEHAREEAGVQLLALSRRMAPRMHARQTVEVALQLVGEPAVAPGLQALLTRSGARAVGRCVQCLESWPGRAWRVAGTCMACKAAPACK